MRLPWIITGQFKGGNLLSFEDELKYLFKNTLIVPGSSSEDVVSKLYEYASINFEEIPPFNLVENAIHEYNLRVIEVFFDSDNERIKTAEDEYFKNVSQYDFVIMLKKRNLQVSDNIYLSKVEAIQIEMFRSDVLYAVL